MKYPIGFPKGGLKWTTPKVIVARAYPGPGSGRAGRLPVDPRASFHATHVAGIAAGDANTTAPAGRDHPLTTGLSGVAPHAWLGNYRVFNAPTPIGNIANTPEIVKAFEDAVADGMDVINFSGGGPQTDPVNDAMYEAVANVVERGRRPGHLGRERPRGLRARHAGSPGTVPDAISVAAVSNSQVFSPALTVSAAGAPAALARVPFIPAGGVQAPRTGSRRTTRSWTSARWSARRASRSIASCAAPARIRAASRRRSAASRWPAPSRSSRAATARSSPRRGAHAQAGAIGIILVDNRLGRGERRCRSRWRSPAA